MEYQVKVSGILHSLEPIMSSTAYRNASFTNPNDISVEAVGKKLFFSSYTTHKMIDKASLSDITSGILKGDDTNCEWTIELKPVK